MINERFKEIPGFPDYFITESGRVYSKRLRGHEKTPRLRELRPKNPGKSQKYYNIILCRDGEQVTKSIHRLVADAFVDGYFDGAVVNHIDGNNRNNHYTNLEWVSQLENVHKSYETSGVDQTRNYKWWDLYDPDGVLIQRFKGHKQLEQYVKANLPDLSASSLSKYHSYRGYYVCTSEK